MEGSSGQTFNLSGRCPHCLKMGNFIKFEKDHQVVIIKQESKAVGGFAGFRVCPDKQCKKIIFVVGKSEEDFETIPNPREFIFDSKSIPINILKHFQEAVDCFDIKAFTASIIMIRRSLEELCLDQGCSGSNLYKRIEDLATKITIPDALIKALDELRLLGNDAAHVELKNFDKIGKDEALIAIKITFSILNSVYQMDDLLDEITNLKKT